MLFQFYLRLNILVLHFFFLIFIIDTEQGKYNLNNPEKTVSDFIEKIKGYSVISW
jgi:hypothetical protein